MARNQLRRDLIGCVVALCAMMMVLSAPNFSSGSETSAQNTLESPLIPRRSIGLSDPFGVVIHSPLDGSVIPPYYVSWNPVRNHAIVEQIKGAGFDTVRLVVEPAGLLTATPLERQEIYRNFDVG